MPPKKLSAARQLEWFEQIALAGDLPTQATRMAAVIAAIAARNRGEASTSLPKLSVAMGLSEVTLAKTLNALVAAGFLSVQRRRGRGLTCIYAVAFPGASEGGQA